MTIPAERTNAVRKTRAFLLALTIPYLSPRVPKKIRELARDLLKHYPSDVDLLLSSRAMRKVWGSPKERK